MTARSVFEGLAHDRPAGRGLMELIATEGRPWSTGGSLQNVTLADGASLAGFSLPGLHQAFWMESIIAGSNRLAAVTMNFPDAITGVNLRNIVPILPAGGSVVIPVRTLIRPGQASVGDTATHFGSMQVAKALDTTLTTAYMFVTAVGSVIYDDLHFSADKVLMWVGDSVNDGTGPSTKTKSVEWGVRKFLRAAGNDLRLSNRSLGGTTTTSHETLRAQGYYDATKPDLIVYSLGINDAITGTATATSQANAQAFIDWKQAVFPAAKLLMIGPTPLTNNTNETNLAAYRTALSGIVTAEADPNVKYLSLGTAFDRTIAGNYFDGATGVHPNDASHAAMLSLVTAALTSFGWTTL